MKERRLGRGAVVAFAFSVFAIAASCRSSEPPAGTLAPIERGPYLQAVTSTSVTVCWRTQGAATSAVAYGEGFAQVAGDTVASRGDHRVTLTGLHPGETEEYRLVGTAAGGHFTTAPADGAPCRAIVFGDSGEGSDEQKALAERMEQEKFDLVLHTGDVVYPSGDDGDYGAKFFAPYRELLRSHPIFCAIGNHDLSYSTDKKARGYCNAFVTFANNPQGSPFYYSFEWGDTKFISLETDMLFKKKGPHLDWLERELASNTRRWLVVFMHVPLYSPGHHKDCPELQATLGPLLERYKVDLVLGGHEHVYERSGPIKKFSQEPGWRGWPYIVTGGGGAHLDSIDKTHDTTIKAEASYHYVVLDFEHDAIAGKTVRLDGTVADEFTLPKQ